jgi:hypothetical protein
MLSSSFLHNLTLDAVLGGLQLRPAKPKKHKSYIFQLLRIINPDFKLAQNVPSVVTNIRYSLYQPAPRVGLPNTDLL